MAAYDVVDAPDDRGHLGHRGPGERQRLRDERVEVTAGQPQPVVAGEPVEQVVGADPFSRIASATPTACSLTASWATSGRRPA
jgi:hypothetical protein